jgi:type III pantothenate kinase
MNLAIDIGNSAIKFGVFKGDKLSSSGIIVDSDFSKLKEILATNEIAHIIYSAVAEIPADLKTILSNFSNVSALETETPLPLKNMYLSPETLGKDRLANACGAMTLFPGKDALVIDVGTCLKFDFVRWDGSYLGGAISPGMRMRFKSLNEQTAQLPLILPQLEPRMVGRNTEESILSGVMNGMMAEINEIIWQYKKLYPSLMVILTGGDSNFFLNQFKSRIFAAPQLTLMGLNYIVSNLPHE